MCSACGTGSNGITTTASCRRAPGPFQVSDNTSTHAASAIHNKTEVSNFVTCRPVRSKISKAVTPPTPNPHMRLHTRRNVQGDPTKPIGTSMAHEIQGVTGPTFDEIFIPSDTSVLVLTRFITIHDSTCQKFSTPLWSPVQFTPSYSGSHILSTQRNPP